MSEKKSTGVRSGWKAYALVGDRKDPSTWLLPHHRNTGAVDCTKGGGEETIDWKLMDVAVSMLSRAGYRGLRVKAQPHEKLAAASHLAGHYRRAGKPLPNALAVLV